jgi:hypothetical protein
MAYSRTPSVREPYQLKKILKHCKGENETSPHSHLSQRSTHGDGKKSQKANRGPQAKNIMRGDACNEEALHVSCSRDPTTHINEPLQNAV